MVYREAPRCHKCGAGINGRYFIPPEIFVGDTFLGWDYEGHRCRVGTKWFIERLDTREWWVKLRWTRDPMSAMMFDSSIEAEVFLAESVEIPARINCIVTEHEFVV